MFLHHATWLQEKKWVLLLTTTDCDGERKEAMADERKRRVKDKNEENTRESKQGEKKGKKMKSFLIKFKQLLNNATFHNVNAVNAQFSLQKPHLLFNGI